MKSNDDDFWNDDSEYIRNSANVSSKIPTNQSVKILDSDRKQINSRLENNFRGIDESEMRLKSSKSPDQLQSIKESKPIYDATKMDSLAQEIIHLGNVQPNYENLNFTSDELVKLKELLDDALDELSISNSDSLGIKQCTRCKKEFEIDDNRLMECRKHSGFFIQDEKHENEGRWVINISK